MNRGQVEDKIEEWHDSKDSRPLHEYLGWSRDDYALYVEFDILPDEQISRELFMQLRSDAYRLANDSDQYFEENKRYKEAVRELRSLSNYDEVEVDEIHGILDRNNV